MSKLLFGTAFGLGAAAIAWTSSIFVGTNLLALGVTIVIGMVYCIGFIELRLFVRATSTLAIALRKLEEPVTTLEVWLRTIDASLQNPVRLRVESERVGLPAPVLTPYLVGLLVMLGLLGTFIGMVDTLRGAVFALQGSTELQAIREGLAAPINGLSLAFGTSVAGVAASAMLGLTSTLSRRDRMLATRLLDDKIATTLHSFSLAHNRQQTYSAVQTQALVMPEVTAQLRLLAENIAQMGDTISSKLFENQNHFHDTVTTAYTALAESVDKSLAQSLSDAGRQAGMVIKPLVADTMAELDKQAGKTQRLLLQSSTQHAADQATLLSETQQQLLQSSAQHAADQATLFSEQFNSGATSLLAEFGRSSTSWLEQQQAGDELKLKQWQKTSEDITQLSLQMERESLARRELEDNRVTAALEQLEGLESTFSAHIANLGSELEAPMTRLIETASETPKAAADVISNLRAEISNNLERDNQMLEERHAIMEKLGALSNNLEGTSARQHAAVETMVTASTDLLSEVSTHFSSHVNTEIAKLSGLVDHFSGNAIEMSSLGESFNLAVKLYSESNSELIEHLNRIELAMESSNNRSDKQMGYYVDQAREIIDQSLLSQREVFDELRELAHADSNPVVEPQ